MRKLSLLFLMLGVLSCDNSSSSSENPVSPGGGVTVQGASTCLDYKNGQLPVGTYAKRVSTGEKAQLDSKGCFSFPATAEVASRSAGTDSIQFYNDSALFALSVPYINHGDVIHVVPTTISYKGCPNSLIDSVFLVVFDSEHMLSRRVKMKRATYRDTSEYSRTVWSLEGGNTFKVHFEVFDKSARWPSQLIESEPGSTMSLTYRASDRAESFVPFIPDTLVFCTSLSRMIYIGGPDRSPLLVWYHRNGGGEYAFGVEQFSGSPNPTKPYYWLKAKTSGYSNGVSSSIYGGVSYRVNGVDTSMVYSDSMLLLKYDTNMYSYTSHIQIKDRAGYGADKQVTVLHVSEVVVDVDTASTWMPAPRFMLMKADSVKLCTYHNSITGAYITRACNLGYADGLAGDATPVLISDMTYRPTRLVLTNKTVSGL